MTEFGFPLVPEATEAYLNDKRRVMYETYRRNFAEWLTTFGKNPDRVEGYAKDTVKRTMYRVGVFERFTWDRDGNCVLNTEDEFHKPTSFVLSEPR